MNVFMYSKWISFCDYHCELVSFRVAMGIGITYGFFCVFFSIANLAIPIRIASCAMRLSAHGISFMWAVISRCRRRGFNFKVYFYRSIFRSQLVFSRGANTCFELSMQLYSNTVTSHKAQYIVMQMLLFSVHKFVIYIQVNLNVTRYCIMLNFV